MSASLFHVTVFRAAGEFKPVSPTEGGLVLFNNKKRQDIKVKVNQRTLKQTIETIKNFNYMTFGNLNVREVYIKIYYGNGNAFKSVMYLNTARIAFYSLTSVLKSVQPLDIHEQFIPIFNKKALEIDFHGILSLSIADIIYGFLLSKWQKFRRVLQRKFKRKSVQKV